jgi:hypothetical protein
MSGAATAATTAATPAEARPVAPASKRLMFARLAGDTRFRYRHPLPFTDGTPRSADTSYAALLRNFRLTSNKGNMIIGESVSRLFRYDHAQSCYLFLDSLHDGKRPLAELRDLVRAHFDAVVFPMANSIRPGLDHTKMAEVIEALDTDVVVLGMGMQKTLPETLEAVSPGTARLLSVLNEKARVFGVRGAETKRWLHAVGLTRAEAYGCPSLYVYARNILGLRPVEASAVRRVATAGYVHKPGRRSTILNQAFAAAAGEIEAHYVLQGEIFEADSPLAGRDDFYNDATGRLDQASMEALFAQEQAPPPYAGYWYFQDVAAWRQFLDRFDCFLGDRFHGGVAALQAGRPAVVLHMDLRVRELTDHFGIPNAPIGDLAEKGVRGVIAERLSAASFEAFHRRYRWRLGLFRSAMREAGLELAIRT